MIFTHAKILESCINELPPSEDETMMISLQALDDSLYDAQAEIMRLSARVDALMGLLSVSDARVAELEAQVSEIPDLLLIAHMQGAEQAKDRVAELEAWISKDGLSVLIGERDTLRSTLKAILSVSERHNTPTFNTISDAARIALR